MGRPPKKPRSARPEWSQRILEARETVGLSQESLAGRVGRSQSTLGEWETGEREPDLADWRRLAEATDTNPAWLAFGIAGPPAKGDAAILDALERYKDDHLLLEAVYQVARMLADEQIGANLPFLFRLAQKVARQAEGLEDQAEAREIIRGAVHQERMEIREGLEQLRRGRL